jgi:hypothetical protein
MVYVPILKIDLPEPRLEELIPGLVTVVVGACTLAFDAVYGFLHPLSPEGEQQIYEATLMNLPREFRKARKCVFVGLEHQNSQQQHWLFRQESLASAFNKHLWPEALLHLMDLRSVLVLATALAAAAATTEMQQSTLLHI